MTLRTILHSPLSHFFAAGAVIFAVFAVLDDAPVGTDPDAITLSIEQAESIVERFTATWNRPPTAQELEGLMESWALAEVNVREALALGLDKGDAVIRERLNLKMQFLAESGAAGLIPDDTALQSYLDANAETFVLPARLAFEQVMLPPDGDARDIRARLENGADPSTLGAASLLPPAVPMMPAPIIDRTFGAGFHASLLDLPRHTWAGPVQSGYGQHLVRVSDIIEARRPPLAEIRDRVEAEWRKSKMRQMRETFSQALLARYAVSLPEAEAVLSR